MELLTQQFYAKMAREFKANKNLWLLVFLSSWLMVFFIASRLSLIAHAETNSFIRLSLFFISYYFSAKLVVIGLSFIDDKGNISYLRYLGISKTNIHLTQVKLIFVFLTPLILLFLLSFWITPWANNSHYSLWLYAVFFSFFIGWILINTLCQAYRFRYFFITLGIYLIGSQISYPSGVTLIVVGLLAFFIKAKNFYLSITNRLLVGDFYQIIFIKPFYQGYLQSIFSLMAYIAYLILGDISHSEDLFLLLVLLNICLTQLNKIALINQKYAIYTDFICLKKDSIWQLNKWVAFSFILIGFIANSFLTNKPSIFLLAFLGILLLTLALSFYLIKRQNPHSFILINAFSILLTFILVKTLFS